MNEKQAAEATDASIKALDNAQKRLGTHLGYVRDPAWSLGEGRHGWELHLRVRDAFNEYRSLLKVWANLRDERTA